MFKNYINVKQRIFTFFFFFRCTWLVIVLTSFVCASILVQTMWLKFNSSPTVTAVKDTHLALYSLPFPAVNVCPMDKIKRSVAYSYISSRINATYQKYQMDYFLNILSLFQHPLYSRMSYYLNNTGMPEFLFKLSSINITDFMLNVSIISLRLFITILRREGDFILCITIYLDSATQILNFHSTRISSFIPVSYNSETLHHIRVPTTSFFSSFLHLFLLLHTFFYQTYCLYLFSP